MPYTLLKDNQKIESGYLLSSKDVCTLDIIPEILSTGVKSLKIEGRMKSPEYVGIVTSIYRKYIDLAKSGNTYIVEKEDKEKLMQIFNRGGFSTGYLKGKLGKTMMYINKPNHIGIEIGEVISYNKNKGYVKVKLSKQVELGDSIAINDSSCKISELMIGNNNIKVINEGQIATIGRIYGEIKVGSKMFKTVCNRLNKEIKNTYSKENIKRKIYGKIILKENHQIKLEIQDEKTKVLVNIESETISKKAEKVEITQERIKEQLSKTGNTIFEFENIDIEMDNNIVIPISSINEIRRKALEELEKKLVNTFKRTSKVSLNSIENEQISKQIKDEVEVSLYLNKINKNIDYTKFEDVDNIYIQFETFLDKDAKQSVNQICKKFNTYILLPAITKGIYNKLIEDNLLKTINENIKGVILSNIAQLKYLEGIENKNIEIIANYNFNIFNDYTIKELKKLGFSKITISPELNKQNIKNLSNNISKELIIYGRTLLMTSEYCTIGTFKNCSGLCSNGKYSLKDRLGFKFPVYTNKINCNNLIYNSKITSIEWQKLNIDSIRIDILEETENEIKNIIEAHKNGKRLEGQDYTNGNLNKEI